MIFKSQRQFRIKQCCSENIFQKSYYIYLTYFFFYIDKYNVCQSNNFKYCSVYTIILKMFGKNGNYGNQLCVIRLVVARVILIKISATR